jgi:S-adenosylhomocysteine hydrolase
MLGSDVQITSANTYFDGPAVSLAAGTWFITATVTVQTGDSTGQVTAKLWDGTTVEASTEHTMFSNAAVTSLGLSGIVVLGSTTTMKVSVAVSNFGATNHKIKAAAVSNGAGNNASHIRAVKIA